MTRHYRAYTQIAHHTLLDIIVFNNQHIGTHFDLNSRRQGFNEPVSINTITSLFDVVFFFNDPTDLPPPASTHRLSGLKYEEPSICGTPMFELRNFDSCAYQGLDDATGLVICSCIAHGTPICAYMDLQPSLSQSSTRLFVSAQAMVSSTGSSVSAQRAQ